MRFPHPLALLVGCILVAAVLTHLLPAGRFERREDAATGRSVVVAGTYARVAPAPVSAFDAIVAIPKGMIDASDIVFYVFLVGGAFAVVEQTGASGRLIRTLVSRLARREALVIPLVSVVFATGGIMIQMQEELIAFVPVLLLLTRRLGYAPLVACAVSIGAAAVGAAFSPVNPFQVIIAQKVAELPPSSATGFRIALLVPALVLWIWATMRYAERTRVPVNPEPTGPAQERSALDRRDLLIAATVVLTFVLFIVGARRWAWSFEQFAALFFLMGVAVGVIGRLGVGGTAEAFVDGFKSLAYAALLIGFARGIFIVLEQGQIIDTVVQGVFAPLAHLPIALSAIGMMLMQTVVHFPVPSTSGQAVLTMPVLVPLSDLLMLSRQVTVLAYQYGAGLCELLTPTNGALVAMLAATGVSFDEWLRFIGRLWGLLMLLGALGLLLAIAVGI